MKLTDFMGKGGKPTKPKGKPKGTKKPPKVMIAGMGSRKGC